MKSCFMLFPTTLVVMLCGALAGSAAVTPDTNKPSVSPLPVAIDKAAWPELNQVAPSVDYNGIPLGEVADHLHSIFKGQFDVVVPSSIPIANPATGALEPMDVTSVSVRLRLQNVKASEVFNAMNLYFAANGTPLQWDLLMNGTRPTAVLRVAPVVLPQPVKAAEPTERSVFFVGDFVDDKQPGKMPWLKFLRAVEEISRSTFNRPAPKLAAHPDASLFIVTGDEEQISFMRSLLEALKQKAKLDTEHPPGSTPPGIPLGGEPGSDARK